MYILIGYSYLKKYFLTNYNFFNKLTPQNKQHNLSLFSYFTINVIIYINLKLECPRGEIGRHKNLK